MFRALLAVIGLASSVAVAAPPVEHFFQLPRFAHMEVSPDGTSIAALSPVAGRQNLVILDVATKKARPITGFTERDVVDVDWVNSKRLVFRTGRLGTQAFDSRGGGLFSVDKDGGNYRLLGEGGQDEQAANAVRMVARI